TRRCRRISTGCGRSYWSRRWTITASRSTRTTSRCSRSSSLAGRAGADNELEPAAQARDRPPSLACAAGSKRLAQGGSMTFLQPMLLIALPLVALPIVIHLINQRRYQTIRWAAMIFLLAANRMSRGYAELRQWLILLFRTLAVGTLVFAVSR